MFIGVDEPETNELKTHDDLQAESITIADLYVVKTDLSGKSEQAREVLRAGARWCRALW